MLIPNYIPDHVYCAPCLACSGLFRSLVPAMCNRISCVQVRELPQGHCGDTGVMKMNFDYFRIQK